MKPDRHTHSCLSTPRGVTWLSVVVNLALSAAKVAAGILCNSQTIIADGVHSLSDLVTDAAVLAGLRVSGKPADADHHYGHMRFTTLVSMFVGAALVATAAWIAVKGILTLREPDRAVSATAPFWIAVASIAVKEGMYRQTARVGRRAGDASVVANAWHHRSDAWTSVAAAAGLAAVAVGGPGWAFIDHVTAVVLASFLGVIGAKILYESGGELVDRAPDARTQAAIEAVIATTDGVRGYHTVRARRIGGKVVVDIHIHVSPDLTVREGHDVASLVTRRLLECEHGIVEVVVHVEPEDDVHEGILA